MSSVVRIRIFVIVASVMFLESVSATLAIPPELVREVEARLDREARRRPTFAEPTDKENVSQANLGFVSSGLTVLSQVPVSAFPGLSGRANDLWGYVSPSGREYAIVGLDQSTGFVEVTDPGSPQIIADIPDGTGLTSDIGVYQHYAYNVADSGPGMQIFDLDQIDNGVVTLLGLAEGGLTGSHNLYLNPDSGFVYPCANNLTAGFVAYDLADPANPQPVGIWTENLAHDLLALSYDDCPYAGRSGPCEIAFVFAGGAGLYSVDVTDKANMVTLSHRTYTNLTYCHQGWATDDRKYLFFDDEIDELTWGVQTTTYIFDISDVSNPQFVTTFTNGYSATDHNLMLRGDLVFEANYRSGLRVFDASDIFNVQEIAFLDTHPESDAPGFSGAWTAYPLLPSGNILLSDIEEGLFIVKMGEPECGVASAPVTDDPVVPRNRFLSVTPSGAGALTALRVVPTDLPGAFETFEGFEFWVGDPFEVSELPSATDDTEPTFTVARLSCQPSFRDWGSLGTIQVMGEPIVPGATYSIQAMSQGCFNADEPVYSSPLVASTGKYGDIMEVCSPVGCTPPDGSVAIADVLAMLAKFVNAPGAVKKARADMRPSCLDFSIDIADVLEGIRGFSGLPYSFVPNVFDDPCASLAGCSFSSR